MKKKTPTKSKSIHPHIRVNNPAQITLLNNLKKATGQKTYSGALLIAAEQFFTNKEEIKEQQKEITRHRTLALEAHEVVKCEALAKNTTEAYIKKHKLNPKTWDNLSDPDDLL